MKIKIWAFSVLLVSLLVSCKKTDGVTNRVSEVYAQRNITFDRDLECCLILPEVGCEGCIAEGVDFFHENASCFYRSQRKNMIVFTAINSRKMLFRALGVDSLGEYYNIMDWDNNYLVEGNNAIYPLVLSLKDGKIIRAEYQSPYSDDVLGNLENKLRK